MVFVTIVIGLNRLFDIHIGIPEVEGLVVFKMET